MVTDDQRAKALNEHFKYEVVMLRGSYICLSLDHGALINNSLIEAFCVHARNLLEFFSSEKSPHGDHPAARHYTTGKYRPISSKDWVHWSDKISAQITHLRYSRPSNDGKIDPADRDQLMHIVQVELKKFRDALDPKWASAYPIELDQPTSQQ